MEHCTAEKYEIRNDDIFIFVKFLNEIIYKTATIAYVYQDI